MSRLDQLSRTIALFRTDLGIQTDHSVDSALHRINVLLSIGHPAGSTRAGQSAILTAASLLARTGHRVYVQAVDGQLDGHHPPFAGVSLHEAILSVRDQLVEGSNIKLGTPDRIDIAFDFGTVSSIAPYQSPRTISVGWSAWSGEISDCPPQPPCTEFDWPMGAMAAAVLVAAEVAKMAARQLAWLSPDPKAAMERFAISRHARLVLAEESTPKLSALSDFTVISAGAVTNGLFYALARLPHVHGRVGVFDADVSESSNLNRNVLLLRQLLHLSKVDLLDHFGHGVKIAPMARRFAEDDLGNLSGRVIVGVDHLPSRWLLARGRFDWMGVGATEHFNVLSSVHYPFSGCPACLHPHDEPGPEITPTIAHVSFLAGLLLATNLIVDIAGTGPLLLSRQRYVFTNAFGSDTQEIHMGVPPRADCPARCPASQIKRAG